MEEQKIKVAEKLKISFPDIVEKKYDGNRLDFAVSKSCVPSILMYLKDDMGFIHLSHISCVDWIEENEFEVIFIVWSPKDKIQVFIRARVDRENPVMENIDMIWRQAHTYEREMREMYGIQFTGLVAPDDFVLEDWNDAPPMRRDFDTAKYAKDTFFERPGRENAKDVRDEIAKRSGEVLPEFAKKYSR